MVKRISLAVVLVLLLLGLVRPGAAVDVVGRLTQVEGRVDFLKGGKLPATPAKLQDGVEPGDVLRTKSLSKAQITFIDNSVITMAPESRLAIEEYMFDAAKEKRRAVLQLFQGLAHALIHQVFKVPEPDFVIKTHTAVLGVRGTEFGIRLYPNASTILNFKGRTRVANIFPEVGQDLMFKKAYKVAISFGKAFVDLLDWQGTTVGRNLPPTLPFDLTKEDYKLFMGQMVTGLMGKKGGKGAGAGTVLAAAAAAAAPAPTTAPDTGPLSSTYNPGTSLTDIMPNNPTIPPSGPSVATYTFTMYLQGFWYQLTANGQPTDTTINVSVSSWASLTGTWSGGVSYSLPTYYLLASSGTNTTTSGTFSDKVYGTYTATMTGSATGVPGQTLTGTMNITINNSYGGTITGTGPVTFNPDGSITYSWNGVVSGNNPGTASRSGTATPGSHFTQTAEGAITTTSSSPYNTQTFTGTLTNGQGTGPSGNSYSFTGTISDGKVAAPSPYGTLPNNTFPKSDSATFTASSEGVVVIDPATGNGTGVMTTNLNFSEGNGPGMLAGPVTTDNSGNLSGKFYGNFIPNGSQGQIALVSGTWRQEDPPTTALRPNRRGR
jgi:hypothetical protein